jgi:protein-S-isoprenylcysteine O-methyltransferase Ste14
MLLGMWPEDAIYLPWDIWIVTWVIAALWANRTIKRPSLGREVPYRIVALVGFVLLLGGVPHLHDGHFSMTAFPGLLGHRYWRVPLAAEWAMVGVAALGFVFAWWARLHLGRLWSGRITRKEGHYVVDTGPYAIVRHPIYTGIFAAAIATTVVIGSVHAIVGLVLTIVGFWIKARIEEDFLREELGPESYDAYRRRVAMLIPFGPK